MQQTSGKRAPDASTEVGPAEAKEKAGLSLDGGRNVGDLLSAAGVMPGAGPMTAQVLDRAPGLSLTASFLTAVITLQPHESRLHSFIQRAGTGPLLRLLPMPSAGGDPNG